MFGVKAPSSQVCSNRSGDCLFPDKLSRDVALQVVSCPDANPIRPFAQDCDGLITSQLPSVRPRR
jgi:hypothetical protein